MPTTPGKSKTLTVLVWACLLLMIVGVILAIVDRGNTSLFTIEFKGVKVSVGNLGLAILLISAFVVWQIILKLAKNVQLFGKAPATSLTWLERIGPIPFAVAAVVAVVFLLIRLL
jgi:uncharacterized protein HemY